MGDPAGASGGPIAVRYRAIESLADAPRLHAVHLGRLAHDRVDPSSASESFPSLEALRLALGATLHGDWNGDWLVAEAAGKVVAYGRVEDWQEADDTWVYLALGWVLPAWRGRGIGTELLHRTEKRIRARAALEHPGAIFEFAANASETERDAAALLLYEGYTCAYTVVEMALATAESVSLKAMPPGVRQRPATFEHAEAIARCVGRAFLGEYPGGRYGERYDALEYAAGLRQARHEPSLWRVAWAGDEVVGAVLCVEREGRGEVFEVAVAPPWRRRGIARALLTAALAGVRARGIEDVRLRTVAEFPTRAIDLYSSVGFRVRKTFPRYRKPGSGVAAITGT